MNPFFYLCGIVASLIAVSNLIYTAKLPKKGLLPNGRKPAWQHARQADSSRIEDGRPG